MELKTQIHEIIEMMPCSEDQVQDYIKELVSKKILPPCMPVFESNYNVVRALMTINRYMSKGKKLAE